MRETRDLEFKKTFESGSFLKTVCAFANYGGGRILFGVTDDGETVGVESPQDACLRIENMINDSVQPEVDYTLDIRKDGTICLSVREGEFKPYMYRNRAYRRNDSATIEVDRLELKRLILEGMNLSFDALPSKVQDLTFGRLEQALTEKMGLSRVDLNTWKTLELYTDRDGFNNAAALLSDCNDFPGIDLVRFGRTINQFLDRRISEKCSVLKQMDDAIDMFRTHYQYEEIRGMTREVVERIPLDAFREAVANALAHRVWDIAAAIKVSMYDDRIEITSPGGLPTGVTEEDYLRGRLSLLRNPIFGNVLFRLHYIERFGTGVMRIERAYAGAVVKPEFQIGGNSITVVLPVIRTLDTLTREEQQVCEPLMEYRELQRSEIERRAGMSKDKAIRVLNSLADRNIVEKTGSGRSTRYKLKD